MFRRRRHDRSHAELERRLVAHGRALKIPEPPDFSVRVEDAIRRGVPSRSPWPRVAVAAVALALTAVAAAAAVPTARTAVFDFFGIGGVKFVLVDRLPSTHARTARDFGQPLTLDRARAKLAFEPRLPHGEQPDRVFYVSDPPGGQITLFYGPVEQPRLLVTEFRGSSLGPSVLKGFTRAIPVDRVRVGDDPGIWLSGRHSFRFLDTSGMTWDESTFLAGKTLVWEHDGVTFRIEGSLTEGSALEIAESFR